MLETKLYWANIYSCELLHSWGIEQKTDGTGDAWNMIADIEMVTLK